MGRKLDSLARDRPLLTAAFLVVACGALGYGAAALASGKLRETLVIASTTLVFGAFLGGVVKLLLEDVQRARERRVEQARFVTAVLADLKAVYDRVERVRVLIAAHRSALTYGEEMRDLIDSAVQLRNVIRAVDQGTSGILEQHLGDLKLAVASMEAYVESLTREFRDNYKPIADKQRIYEGTFDHDLEERAGPELRPPENEAWREIEQLPMLREFLGSWPADPDHPADYARDFEGALDLATWILRSELKLLADGTARAMPSEHAEMRDRIAERRSPPPGDSARARGGVHQ